MPSAASIYTPSSGPVIRRRSVTSRRRRDGLIRFAKDNTSQNGEDGILERIFALLAEAPAGKKQQQRWCVDVGAWDGVHLSNTNSLLMGVEPWRGILIEGDTGKFAQLSALHATPLKKNLCLHRMVSGASADDPNSLVSILNNVSVDLPRDFDFLCIDIDGADYWLLNDLLESSSSLPPFTPKVICIEFNPSMPDDLIYIPSRAADREGCSLSALVELASKHNYTLVETTLYNAFFVQTALYERHLAGEVPDTSIEALHETTMGTALYQLYDGTIKLWGCKKLLWHRLPLDERRLQVLSPEQRSFPFQPEAAAESNAAFNSATAGAVIDLAPFFATTGSSSSDSAPSCLELLRQQLKKDGFCYVRGLGIPRDLCEQALFETDAFLDQADESIRRTCLTKDRARRGYSPMNVENFASLIGEKGPNDLVRKFRVGPLQASSVSSLLQPNIWPKMWDRGDVFQPTVEEFYSRASTAGETVVQAICQALTMEDPSLESPLKPLTENDLTATSILTLLSYRLGSRHKAGRKSKGPLVAAHTDVGVATMLLFADSNSCAALQRSDGKGGWIDVSLPPSVPDDPIFVVNIADCFADLSGGKLPSTLHRVVARKGRVARSCCALFVGLDPKAELTLSTGESMTYEEWRKKRIERSQSVLKEQS